MEVRFRQGYVQTEVPVLRLKSLYLGMQIKLLKERQKLAAGKGKQALRP